MPHLSVFLCRSLNQRFWVLPYVRRRLVFADMAVKAMLKNNFDEILLDLPFFMNQKPWLDAPLEAFPLVSSLLIKGDNESCLIYPLVPTDAACAAAWLARKRALPFQCVDSMILETSGDDIPTIPDLGDERLVSKMGSKAYFQTAWTHLDSLWEKAPDSSLKSLIARGKCVATRISDKPADGRRTLFICEYRLWWAVHRALRLKPGCPAKSQGNDEFERGRSCALLLEDPYQMWAAGLFDDYPAINKKFQESLESGNIESFDKFTVLSDLVNECSKRGCATGVQNDGPNKLAALAHNLKFEQESEGGRSLPPGKLLESISSCLGPGSEDATSRLFLDYPLPTASSTAQNPPEYFEIRQDKILPSSQWFELPDVFHARPYGELCRSEMEVASAASKGFALMPWLHSVHPLITRQEAKSLGERTSDYRWAVERDYELHSHACSLARDVVSRTKHPDLEGDVIGLHTPVVFIFCSTSGKPGKLTLICDNNATRRQMQLQGFERMPQKDEPAPDFVYSLFATVGALETLFEGHIERELITTLAILFSGRGMGVERFTAITREPRRYQCRVRPQEDPVLKSFHPSELGLAWAAKHARKTAIVVAGEEWKPSQAVQKFLQRRRKRILTVPHEALPEGLINRLRQLHFISTALKLHPDCKRIVARFVK